MKNSRTVVGVDTAKRVFQLHWVDLETGEMVDMRLSRGKFLEHFANRAPCLVGLEACGGSQHWARRLRELGHEVRMVPAKMVRPFVSGNKNDAHDARAIWTAVQQPGVKTVAVKSEEQQGVLALHRMRQQLVKFRTAQINGLRGLLAEYGEVMPRGRAGMRRDMPAALARVSERLPAMVVETLRDQWARVAQLDAEVGAIERRLAVWHRSSPASRRIAAIPGVGVSMASENCTLPATENCTLHGRTFWADPYVRLSSFLLTTPKTDPRRNGVYRSTTGCNPETAVLVRRAPRRRSAASRERRGRPGRPGQAGPQGP